MDLQSFFWLGAGGVEGLGFLVFCLYCGVFCLPVFKLFRHITYCEYLTAQGTVLEL